jgi:hypothetical protein
VQADNFMVESVLSDSALFMASTEPNACLLTFQSRSADVRASAKGLYAIAQAASGDPPPRRVGDSYNVAHETLTKELPTFERLPFEAIAEVWDKVSDSLRSFRVAVQKVAASIEHATTAEEYSQEIADAYTTQIAPSVDALRREVGGLRLSIGSRMLAASSFVIGAATFLASAHIGLPIVQALATSFGLAGVSAVGQSFLQRAEARARNGVSFVLELEEAAQRTVPGEIIAGWAIG